MRAHRSALRSDMGNATEAGQLLSLVSKERDRTTTRTAPRPWPGRCRDQPAIDSPLRRETYVTVELKPQHGLDARLLQARLSPKPVPAFGAPRTVTPEAAHFQRLFEQAAAAAPRPPPFQGGAPPCRATLRFAGSFREARQARQRSRRYCGGALWCYLRQQKSPIYGDFLSTKPSDGLEPSTPSLPSRASTSS
jgi:hypothetical protein